MVASARRATRKYAPVLYLAVLAALAWGLWQVFPGDGGQPPPEPKDLLVAPADSRSGELVLNDGRLRIPLNAMAAPETGAEERSLEIVLKGDPKALEEGLAIGSLGQGEKSAELVLRYTESKAGEKPAPGSEKAKKSKPPGPDKRPTGKAEFRPGARDDSHTGLWLAVLVGLGLATIGGRYLLMRPERFTEDSKTFRGALKIWHPWIVLMNRTPRTIKRFLNRLRYVAMRLRGEAENLSLWERLRRKMSGKEEAKAEEEITASVPEPVLVALGAIYHVKPEWVSDTETLQAIFAEDIATLADRIRQALPDAKADSENLPETAKSLNQAIMNYRQAFKQDVEPLIAHREAFLEVLAETGM